MEGVRAGARPRARQRRWCRVRDPGPSAGAFAPGVRDRRLPRHAGPAAVEAAGAASPHRRALVARRPAVRRRSPAAWA